MKHLYLITASLVLPVLLSFGCAIDQTAANKQTVARATEAINARDIDALDAFIAPDLLRHSGATPGIKIESLEQFKAFIRQDIDTSPDSHQEIEFMLAENDLVAMFATYRGTQQGPFGPFPPTGKSMELPIIAIFRLEDGLIAEIWAEWDNMNALAQLGHFPPPATAPEN